MNHDSDVKAETTQPDIELHEKLIRTIAAAAGYKVTLAVLELNEALAAIESKSSVQCQSLLKTYFSYNYRLPHEQPTEYTSSYSRQNGQYNSQQYPQIARAIANKLASLPENDRQSFYRRRNFSCLPFIFRFADSKDIARFAQSLKVEEPLLIPVLIPGSLQIILNRLLEQIGSDTIEMVETSKSVVEALRYLLEIIAAMPKNVPLMKRLVAGNKPGNITVELSLDEDRNEVVETILHTGGGHNDYSFTFNESKLPSSDNKQVDEYLESINQIELASQMRDNELYSVLDLTTAFRMIHSCKNIELKDELIKVVQLILLGQKKFLYGNFQLSFFEFMAQEDYLEIYQDSAIAKILDDLIADDELFLGLHSNIIKESQAAKLRKTLR